MQKRLHKTKEILVWSKTFQACY